MSKRTFMDMLLAGDALLTDIDDYIDAWHDGSSKESISDFLGMTRDEYALWVEKPHSLRYIAFSRRHGVPVSKALETDEGVKLAARSGSRAEARKIRDWLKETGRI